MCRFTPSYPTLLLLTLAAIINVPSMVSAQITHDPVNQAYFVTGDAVINSDIGQNDVFVGKNNAYDFATQSNGITLMVEGEANVEGAILPFPVGQPNAPYYWGVYAYGNNSVNMTNGTIWGYLSGHDSTTVTMTGGIVMADGTFAYDDSTLNLGGTAQTYNTISFGNSVVNIDGHADAPETVAYDNSTLNIGGDARLYNLDLLDHSHLTMNGGWAQNDVWLADQSQGRFGGTAKTTDLFTFGTSRLSMTGGTVTWLMKAFDHSVITVTGGTAGSFMEAYTGSTIDIYGGNIGSVLNWGGTINIRGGNIAADTLASLTPGPFQLFGNNIQLDHPTAGTFSAQGFDYTGVYWDLTGVLSNGDVFNTRYFERNGNIESPTYYRTGFGVVMGINSTAPEPVPLLLLLPGILCLLVVYRKAP